MSTLPVGPVRSVSPDCFRAARGRFRSLLLGGLVSAVSMGLATILPHTALGQNQEESKTELKRTLIVLNDENSSTQKMLEQLREQLKDLPPQKRDEILASVAKALSQATKRSGQDKQVVVTTVDADGKPLSTEGNVVTMTIVQDADPKGTKSGESQTRVTARVEGKEKAQKEKAQIEKTQSENLNLNLNLKSMADGMMLRRITRAENLGGPMFRIGLSIEAPEQGDGGEGGGATAEGKSVRGLIVERIMDESPASEAGIEQGDVILMINGKEAKDFASLQEAVQQAGKEDRPVKLKLERGGKELTVKIKPVESADVGPMSFDLVPPIGSVLPLDMPGGGMLEGRVVEGLRMLSPMEFGGKASEQTTKDIAELKEEIQELKEMVKKLLEKVEAR
jgi:membrane-associated protease RseP (regulator of RpoE activity)